MGYYTHCYDFKDCREQTPPSFRLSFLCVSPQLAFKKVATVTHMVKSSKLHEFWQQPYRFGSQLSLAELHNETPSQDNTLSKP